MAKLKTISLLAVLLALTILAGFSFTYILSSITGKTIDEKENQAVLQTNYSYTAAICNSKKECIDVHIFCENNSVSKIEPISELIKFPESWKDPRNSNKTRLC